MHDLMHATLNLIHYTTQGFLSEGMEYLQFYHQKIKIFCTKKNRKTSDLKKISLRNMAEIALTP